MLSPTFSPFPQIITNRLLLRPLTLCDAPAVHRLRSDVKVMQYINRPLTRSIEEAERWIGVVLDALQKKEGITWCICLKETPAYSIGNIGHWRIEKENYRSEIGYMLDPAFQGKGLMTEALQAVLQYGFTTLQLHSIEARIDPQNKASKALLKKAGFVQEAYFTEDYFFENKFGDTAVFCLLTPYREKIT